MAFNSILLARIFAVAVLGLVAACQHFGRGDATPATGNRYCDGYARAAVAQNQTNLRERCGFGPGPRWQSTYRNHYRWCLSAPKAAVDAEDRARRSGLQSCAKPTNNRSNKFCSDYAREAVAQNKRNRAKRCGYGPGPRWQSNFNNHYNWCTRVSHRTARDEARVRRNRLRQCN